MLVSYLLHDSLPLGRLSQSADTRALMRILNQLRAGKETTFDCGDGATVARLLMAVLATHPGNCVLTGSERLCQRPMAPLIQSLIDLGGPQITCLRHPGCLPVRIEGAIPEKKLAVIDPSLSGQFVSALLIAGAAMPRGLHVRMVGKAPSRPYIEMTCKVLQQAGASNDYAPTHNTIRVEPFKHQYFPHAITVERDWSAAAFFYMAALFLPHRRLRLLNLSLDSLQGDRVVADLFGLLGVKTKEVRSPFKNSRSVTIEGCEVPQRRFKYDFTNAPDLVPALAVACAAMGVDAYFSGIRNLRVKESDRVMALTVELQKMQCQVECGLDKMHIIPSPLHPILPVKTYGDHRIAMAFGMLKLLFPEIVIENPNVVEKSFPDFWKQLSLIKI